MNKAPILRLVGIWLAAGTCSITAGTAQERYPDLRQQPLRSEAGLRHEIGFPSQPTAVPLGGVLQWRAPLSSFTEPSSVIVKRRDKCNIRRDPNENAGLWRLTVGNRAAENWSPYPDRLLDARTLRFPLPKKTLERHRQPNKK